MSLYNGLLFIHILAAGTWLGGGMMLVFLAVRARQVGREPELITQMEWVGSRIGGPAVLATLITGVWMVLRTDAWQFSQVWVWGGLAILILLFVIGVGFHVPQYKRIRQAQVGQENHSPRVQQLITQSFGAARLEVVLIAAAIFLMVFKPGA